MRRVREISTRVLDWFADWFASVGGVWQTLFICCFAVGVEIVFPGIDDHMFYLMGILTLYSGVTQPALAYVARRGSEKTDHDHGRDEKLLRHIDRVITERLEGKE